MSALETGLLQEEEDLGCWKYLCHTKKERDHQLRVGGTLLAVALISWVIVLSVMVFQLKTDQDSDTSSLNYRLTDLQRTVTKNNNDLLNSINNLQEVDKSYDDDFKSVNDRIVEAEASIINLQSCTHC